MNTFLIALIGFLYVYIGGAELYAGKLWSSLIFFGYALAQTGLYFVTKAGTA